MFLLIIFNIIIQEHFVVLRLVKEIHDKYHVTFNPVPVGDFDTVLIYLFS